MTAIGVPRAENLDHKITQYAELAALAAGATAAVVALETDGVWTSWSTGTEDGPGRIAPLHHQLARANEPFAFDAGHGFALPFRMRDGRRGALIVVAAQALHLDATRQAHLQTLASATIAFLEAHLPRVAEEPALIDILAPAFDAAGDCIAIHRVGPSPAVPRFIYANRRFEELFGYSAANMTGESADFLHGPLTSKAVIRAMREQVRAGSPACREVQLYNRDGEPRWIELNIAAIGAAGPIRHWIAIYRDVALRKHNDERQRLLTAAFDSATDMIWVSDSTPVADGGPLIEYANREFFRETGYEPSEVIGRPPSILHGPNTDPLATRQANEAIDSRRELHNEWVAYRKDGSWFHLEVNGRPVFNERGEYVNRIVIGRNITEKRRLEERLAMLTQAIENADDNVFIYELEVGKPETRRVVYVNDAIFARTGFTKEEIYARSTAALVGPKTDLVARDAAFQDLVQGKTARIELELYRKDGSTYWSEMNARPIADEAGRLTRWLVIERDATARRQNEMWMRSLTIAIDHATDYVFITDGSSPAEGGPFIRWMNETMLRDTGYTLDEVAGKPPAMFFGPLTSRQTIKTLIDAVASGAPTGGQFIGYCKNGTPLWVEYSGRMLNIGGYASWVAVGRNVTERRAAEERIVQESRKLGILFDVTQRFNATFDGKSLETALAAGISELVGRPAHIAYGSDATVRGERIGVRIESGPADAPLTENELSACQLAIQSYEAAARRTAVYAALEEQRGTMMSLSAHKSELIAMLAHDFKGPLTTIMGFSEILDNDVLTGEDHVLATKAITSAADRLLALANDTLALAQLEYNELDVTFEPLDFVGILGGVVAAHSSNRNVSFETQAASLAGFGDKARLRQAFENLVGNALKYSPKTKPVSVSIAAGDDDTVVVTVTDRGIGIPSAEHGRIFEKFSRASNARARKIAGTGLGLSFVKAVIERHGGEIKLESRENVGSTFTVRLPRDPANTLGTRLSVVLVDGDGDPRSFTAHALRLWGYSVRVVGSLEMLDLEQVVDDHSIMVIDAEHAGAGIDEIAALTAQAERAKIPTLVLAGGGSQNYGPVAVLSKPFLEDELRDALRAVGAVRV